MGKTRKYGANYLSDSRIAKRIVNLADLRGKDILEVGAGSGQLTKYIKGYKTLTVIERNRNFESILRSSFPEAKVIIADALEIDWNTFQIFISDMPYSISSPLLEKLWNHDFEVAIITVQKEVADRILASPGKGEYSRLSVMMQLMFEVTKKFEISPGAFKPAPKVYSTVLRLERKDTAIPKTFGDFLKQLFSQRRKKIRNIVPVSLYQEKRPGELTIDELLQLYRDFNEQPRF